ncbi:MAG: hypothetical protein LQ351_006392 [Letrouitia transgressa]|nr:MAG: hypothetical protein LQ351_006392 [Letrouitia transgressa]
MAQFTTTFDLTSSLSFGDHVVEVKTRVTQTSKGGTILPVQIADPEHPGVISPFNLSHFGSQPTPATPTSANPNPTTSPTSSVTTTSRTASSSKATPNGKKSASPTRARDPDPISTPNPSNNTNASSNSNPISSGAAAGIGIGSAAAGALIAAFIVWLLMRRSRRSRRPARTESIRLNGFASTGKPGSGGNPSDASSAAVVVERTLPQPADDQAISSEISRLRTLIKNHAQSYYHSSPARASATGVDQAALGAIAMGNMPIISSTLTTLLSNPSTRMPAIRFCIAWTAISRIDLGCEPVASFLPPEIASCIVSMTGMRDDPQTHMAFLSKWRTISAALLQRSYGSGSFSSSDPRNRNINNALEALNTLLRPYADSQRDDNERERKLEEIMRRAARFGFLLFSQPSTWNFDWETPQNAGRGALVIFPALLQVGDDNGKKTPIPRALEEQELARGLERYL